MAGERLPLFEEKKINKLETHFVSAAAAQPERHPAASPAPNEGGGDTALLLPDVDASPPRFPPSNAAEIASRSGE